MYISCAASMLGYVVADWRFLSECEWKENHPRPIDMITRPSICCIIERCIQYRRMSCCCLSVWTSSSGHVTSESDQRVMGSCLWGSIEARQHISVPQTRSRGCRYRRNDVYVVVMNDCLRLQTRTQLQLEGLDLKHSTRVTDAKEYIQVVVPQKPEAVRTQSDLRTQRC